jgi:hypothetical protein
MTDVHNPDTLIHEEKLAHNPLFAGKDVAQKAQDHVAKLMTIKLEQESHYEARQATGSQEDDAQSAAIFQGAAVVLAKPAAALPPLPRFRLHQLSIQQYRPHSMRKQTKPIWHR